MRYVLKVEQRQRRSKSKTVLMHIQPAFCILVFGYSNWIRLVFFFVFHFFFSHFSFVSFSLCSIPFVPIQSETKGCRICLRGTFFICWHILASYILLYQSIMCTAMDYRIISKTCFHSISWEYSFGLYLNIQLLLYPTHAHIREKRTYKV